MMEKAIGYAGPSAIMGTQGLFPSIFGGYVNPIPIGGRQITPTTLALSPSSFESHQSPLIRHMYLAGYFLFSYEKGSQQIIPSLQRSNISQSLKQVLCTTKPRRKIGRKHKLVGNSCCMNHIKILTRYFEIKSTLISVI